MNQGQFLEDYQSILSQYNITPQYIEEYGNVQKIFSKGKIYALKKVNRHQQNPFMFLYAQQLLTRKGYKKIVPLIPTAKGQFYTLDHSNIYYVMPWVYSDTVQRKYDPNKELVTHLAHLHNATTERKQASKRYFKQMYQDLLTKFDKGPQLLNIFIETCEKRIYMSPYELFYCLNYYSFIEMYQFAKSKLEEWYELVNNQNEIRQVLSHGRPMTSHLVYDGNNNSYLINFDHSFNSFPIYDLVSFIRQKLFTHPNLVHDTVMAYEVYQRNYALTDDEMLLLLIYLMDLEPINRSIVRYQNERHISEMTHVRYLQKYTSLLHSSFKVVNEIERLYQEEKEEQEQNEDST